MNSTFQQRLHEVMFEADTRTGRIFDIGLLLFIVLSVIVVMLESIGSIEQQYGPALRAAEWIVTGLFTIEYILRIIAVSSPMRYACSFYGVVDLLAILPTYLSLFISGSQYLLVVRAIRLLRIFRVLKLARFIGEAKVLTSALQAARHKIVVFLGGVFTAVVIIGALMYVIEGETHGFTSIPKSMYWAIVTLTTVGYGDIAPQTVLGQTLSAIVMIMGYGIIAVPTGIVSVEIARANDEVSTQACLACGRAGHDYNARYCKFCGGNLYSEDEIKE